MASLRLDSDKERLQSVWVAAKKLSQHPTLEALLHKIALFSQAEPQRASLTERLLGRDQSLFRMVSTAISNLVPGDEPFHVKAVQLGDMRTTQAVLTVGYHELLRTLAPIAGLDYRALFKQAIAVASASEIFAERSCRFPPHEAYGAGLMHHLGLLLMGITQRSTYPALIQQVRENKKSLEDAETKAYGFSHDEAGELAGEAWNFSNHVLEGMRYHSQDPAGQKTIGLCIALGSRFCHANGYDAGLGDTVEELPAASYRCVGVGEHNVQRVVEIVRNQTETFDLLSVEMLREAA